MARKLMVAGVLLSMVATLPAAAQDLEALKAEGKQVMMKFGGTLKKELVAAMESGGPVKAIGVCNQKAPSIAAATAAETGWTVKRTSQKLRNPASAPDALEQQVLQDFQSRIAKGESPADLTFAKIVETPNGKVFRFIKAIPTEDLCLNCHGSQLQPEVKSTLDSLYPNDQATGYKAGDMRGVFTLTKPL